jgi:hypothetical protein
MTILRKHMKAYYLFTCSVFEENMLSGCIVATRHSPLILSRHMCRIPGRDFLVASGEYNSFAREARPKLILSNYFKILFNNLKNFTQLKAASL